MFVQVMSSSVCINNVYVRVCACLSRHDNVCGMCAYTLNNISSCVRVGAGLGS